MMRAANGSDLTGPPVRNETLAGVRGGVLGGVRIHSLHLPGIVGWHEVVFACEQETLTIRHDDNGREGYVPAVATAIRKVMQPDVVGLVRGYNAVIGPTE